MSVHAYDLQNVPPSLSTLVESLCTIVPWLPAQDEFKLRFGTLYPIAKLHKTPMGWRFITSVVGTVLHDGAVLLQATTLYLLERLKHVCACKNREAKVMHQCNVQFYPLIPDGRVCLLNVYPRERYLCDFCADVDHCFDVIPHTSLLAGDDL